MLGSTKLAAVRLGLDFGKVADDTGFCRGHVSGRGRCRPCSSWHTLIHSATDSFAHEVSGAKRRSDLFEIHIPRQFDQIRGSIICAKGRPTQFDRHFTCASFFENRSISTPSRSYIVSYCKTVDVCISTVLAVVFSRKKYGAPALLYMSDTNVNSVLLVY